MPMAEWVFTVSEVTDYIKRVLQAEDMLQDMQVSGEISGLRRAASGHMYFTVKDTASQLQCVYFRPEQDVLSVKNLAEGMQVTLRGRVSLYSAGGQLNFVVKSVRNNGVGNMYTMIEERKQRLHAQGFFDDEHKKALPVFPRRIGVITSRQGAVIRDIIRIAVQNNPKVNLLLYPVRVQGDGAAQEMILALEHFNRMNDIDVVILGRGGGSYEDLFEFNDEDLVKAVYNSRVPVVSAVGHEVDYTLVDFAADLRAATPTEAAQIVVPDVLGWIRQVSQLRESMNMAAKNAVVGAQSDWAGLNRLLHSNAPQEKLNQMSLRSDALASRLHTAGEQMLRAHTQRLEAASGRLAALGPQAVLKRGYALVLSQDGRHVDTVEGLTPGDKLDIQLHRGGVYATVDNVRK